MQLPSRESAHGVHVGQYYYYLSLAADLQSTFTLLSHPFPPENFSELLPSPLKSAFSTH